MSLEFVALYWRYSIQYPQRMRGSPRELHVLIPGEIVEYACKTVASSGHLFIVTDRRHPKPTGQGAKVSVTV